MKNHAKKVFAIVIALMLVAVSVIPAFAQTGAFTIKIVSNGVTSLTETQDGNRFTAYQIFDGDVVYNEETKTPGDGNPFNQGGQLANITWGDGVNVAKFIEALSKDTTLSAFFATDKLGTYNESTNYDTAAYAVIVADVLSANKDNAAFVKAFAKAAGKNVKGSGAVSEWNGTDSSYDIAVAKAGYYVVVDNLKDFEQGDNDATSSFILDVVNDRTVKIKNDIPSVDKNIIDNGNRVDGLIEDTNTIVTFELKGTLPDNFADFDKYMYTFHDTLSKGLTYKGEVQVKVYDNSDDYRDKKVSATATLTLDADHIINPATECEKHNATVVAAGGTKIDFVFDDLTQVTGLTSESIIVVEYKAQLNKDAILGNANGNSGNVNDVNLEYTNDPNGNGTGQTNDEEVQVYTFGIELLKKSAEGNNEVLPNAEFKLSREATVAEDVDEDGRMWAVKGADGMFAGWTDEEGNGSVFKTDAYGKLYIDGLEAGTYFLKETLAPSGYNAVPEIKIVITARIGDNGKLDADNVTFVVDPASRADAIAGETKFDANGRFTITVLDTPATELPGTGGMGTTIFYIAGATMLAVAFIVLVATKAKKKVTE